MKNLADDALQSLNADNSTRISSVTNNINVNTGKNRRSSTSARHKYELNDLDRKEKASKDNDKSIRKNKVRIKRVSSYSPPSSNENLQSLKTGLVGAHNFLVESSNNEIFNNIQLVSKVFDSMSLLNDYYSSQSSSSVSSCASIESESSSNDHNNECNVEGSVVME